MELLSLLLFFDDKHLLLRENLKRICAQPQLEAVYIDPVASTSAGFPSVVRDPKTGLYHMFYQGWLRGDKIVTLAAASKDGLHFQPRSTARQAGITAPVCDHQLLAEMDGELALVFEDHHAPEDKRLKALVAVYNRPQMQVKNILFTSGDGIHWILEEGVRWNTRGAEPGAGCFYCEATESYILTQRPDWGVRRICIAETRDWQHFSDPELVLQADALDEPLTETYGMPAFAYDGWYIGFLWLYQPPQERGPVKYWKGKVHSQLTYSVNGRHFQRALRQPFIGNGDPASPTWGMVFPSALYTDAEGNLVVAASACRYEHGHFADQGGGSIVFYRLRKDGFVALESTGGPGLLCTRGLLTAGGELEINIEAPYSEATCCIYTHGGIEPMPGYSHEDCIPFTGDSTKWVPSWKEGRTFSQLAGQVVYIEVKLNSGMLYSIRGQLTPMMVRDVDRYVKFGTIPDVRGFF